MARDALVRQPLVDDSQRDHYEANLRLHAGYVENAERDLERSRDGLHYWIGDAVLRGVMTEEEVASIVREDIEYVTITVRTERSNGRHSGLR
jgi:hypothetical protein